MEGTIEGGGQATVETVVHLEEAEENKSSGCKSKLKTLYILSWL